MSMKADRGEVVSRGDHREEEFDKEHFGDEQMAAHLDGFVPVLFPQVSWDAVQELAKKINASPGEVMSIALKLLEERLTEEARKLDGAGSG